MQAYCWRKRDGSDYVVFAPNLLEAKKILEKRYSAQEIKIIVSNKPTIKPMPEGFCCTGSDIEWFVDDHVVNIR